MMLELLGEDGCCLLPILLRASTLKLSNSPIALITCQVLSRHIPQKFQEVLS
jgi:hypothetical protein